MTSHALSWPVRILAVDPGLATGGALLVERERFDARIVASLSMSTDADRKYTPVIGDKEFSRAIRRSGRQAETLRSFISEHEPDLIAIEAFVDLASRKRQGAPRQDKKRWTTPLAIGRIASMLDEIEFSADRVFWQNPVALRQFKVERALLTQALKATPERTKRVIMEGDQMVSTEHLISAFCHYLYLEARLMELPGLVRSAA